MRGYPHWAAALMLCATLTPSLTSSRDLHPAPLELRFEPRFVLEAVAREMNVTLRPEIPLPAVLRASTTPLRRFQDAMARQWGFRPHVFANAYAIARNEIYLMDDPAYYARMNRTLEDSLAHELVHYIQVHYFKADLTDPSCEIDAIAVQERFRESHIDAGRAIAAR